LSCLLLDHPWLQTKLEHKPERGRFRSYKTPMEFRDDVRLVWQNCRTYNPVGTQVRQLGDRISDAWEKKWLQAEIEKKWEQLQEELLIEEVGANGTVRSA
jgi:Bromodomain